MSVDTHSLFATELGISPFGGCYIEDKQVRNACHLPQFLSQYEDIHGNNGSLYQGLNVFPFLSSDNDQSI